MGNLAKGSASISINSKESEARLVFIPNPDEVGWDVAAITKLASEHQLGAFHDLKALETFIAKAARAKTSEPMEIIYAQGIEPQNPIPEKITWESLPVPGDMLPFQEEVLENAPPPKLFRIKVEKVKKETKVSKPGALPFIAGKEEVTVSWEKKEVREKVVINPEVIDIMYADRGRKLGAVVPSSPGKPGKSVFGRQINPEAGEDGTYLIGEGISRDKNELLAKVSGFIRVGENWADIVPLAKPSWKITTGSDGITLFFQFEPGDPRFTPPTGAEILASAVEAGADEGHLISQKELDDEIVASIKKKTPVEAFALLRVSEAEARVDINHDKTRATLYLRKSLAGAMPLSMKVISQAIKESGVHGFDAEKLKVDLQTFMEGKDLVLSDYVLAEGIPSTRGQDREIQVAVNIISDAERAPILARLKDWYSRDVLEEVKFDLRKEMSFAFVPAGSVIATVSASSEGEPGKDIFGEEIPGIPGNDPDIRILEGLKIHGNEIVAATGGLLLFNASEKSFKAEVLEWQDAKIGIHTTEDLMEVKGDFFREEGAGIPLTLANVKKVLTDLGITKGINWQAAEEACVIARAKGHILGRVLARGLHALAKGDSAHKWLVPIDLHPGEENKRVIQLKAGAPIILFSEPIAEGRPGYDVKGREIPISEAVPQTIEYDETIKEEPYGKGRRLIALRPGDLNFFNGKLSIFSVKTIEGDTEENLKFSGEIRVKGNLLPGCMIMTGSHVLVSGFADQALVSSGGKVVIIKGIKGGGRGIIRAKSGIEADYTERASLVAMGDIKLKKGSIFSVIRTNGKLLISDGNGKINGGICHARAGIETASIGSDKANRTEISFGQDYFIKEKLNSFDENIGKLNDQISKIDKMTEEKERLIKLLEHLKQEASVLKKQYEEHFDSEVIVHGIVYPGVVFESHNRYYEIMQQRNGVIFSFDRKSGTIKERPIK